MTKLAAPQYPGWMLNIYSIEPAEMSSMSGPVHEATPQSAYPNPNESNPTDRRNRLSKTVR